MSADSLTKPTFQPSGRNYAREISDHLMVAQYYSRNAGDQEWHMQQAREQFEKLAKVLGYRIERIEDE